MKKISFPVLFSLLILSSCERDPILTESSGYPREIGKIILTECAVEGCHNSASSDAAGGLNLETWNDMFSGSRNGSVIIPYQHWLSQMFLFTNTYPELGISVEPAMPFNEDPLSKDQVILIRDWINRGAPDLNGDIKFSGIREKVYVANQSCDLVTVLDRKTRLATRFVNVGVDPLVTESPHMVKVSPDGRHWYVCFVSGQVLQKFDATTDELVASIDLTNGIAANAGSWNTISISSDSKTAYVADLDGNGKVAIVDLEAEQLATPFSYIGGLNESHGTAISPDNQFLYVSAQTGNYVHKVNLQDLSDVVKISLDGLPPTNAPSLDIHELIFSPDGTKYYSSCQLSNEVRVMSYPGDSLLKVIPTAVYPQEFAVSTTRNLLFVSCPEDDVNYENHRGSVEVIDMATDNKIKNIKTGFQSHGIGVDEKFGLLYVANRNASSSGPAPHHTTDCGGRNGYLTAVDLNTLELITGFRPEVSVDPYSIAVRN